MYIARKSKTLTYSTRQVKNQNFLDNFGEVSFSVVYDTYMDSFSELLYTQSDFPCECHFLAPGSQKGVKIHHFQ